jgi:hypothetical protein
MDLGRADDNEDVAHARIWFDFVLRADLLALYLATPAAQQSPPPRVLLRHLVAALLAPRSAPVSASTQAALLRICVALLCGPLRATAVRAVEDALDAPLQQWHLVQLLGSVAPSDAVHADELQLLRNRWLLRNRLAVHDALECAAAAVAVDGWLAHRCASDCVSELVVDTSCDLAQWHVLVDARIDHAAAVLARVDGAAAVSERLVALRTLCRALLAADSSAAQRHALVEVERARLAGDADRLTQLLAVDNCEAAAVLGVDYRRALAKQLRAAPLPTHAAAAAVAADALVVLEAARGIVATGECGAGVRAQCEAALSVRDKGSAVVRERIGALLERATFAERVRAACACADAPQSLLPASPSDPILRLLLRTGDDADGVARAAIECGADAAFLARGVAERVSAGAPTSAWLSECAGASPQLAMQQWLAGGGVGAAPPLVSLDCATLERVIAECADAGSVELLRRVLDAQVPSDAAVVHFGAGVCALFPLIASAAASGAACELEDSAWRAMVAFVDAIVRSKSTRGGNAAAFSVHRLVERVRDVATLARLYGLVRGALASCVQQTAYHPVSVELVAEPLGAALRSDDAKWGAAVVLQTRKRSIHASLDAERRLLLFAQSIAGAWARRTADVDVAARLRVAAADACARVPVPEAALFHFAGAVGIATAHCTDAGAHGGSFVDAVGALLNAEALERLATVLAHARNFCAAACVCQFVPQGARLAYQLLATPWRANDWKRAYLAALFDVTIGELLAKRCFVRGWQATGDDVVRLLSTPERNEHNDAANRARVRDACCRRLFALLHREYCQLAGDAPSALLDDVAGDEDGNGGVTRAAEAAAAAAAAALAAAAARLQSDGGDEQADETMQIEQ